MARPGPCWQPALRGGPMPACQTARLCVELHPVGACAACIVSAPVCACLRLTACVNMPTVLTACCLHSLHMSEHACACLAWQATAAAWQSRQRGQRLALPACHGRQNGCQAIPDSPFCLCEQPVSVCLCLQCLVLCVLSVCSTPSVRHWLKNSQGCRAALRRPGSGLGWAAVLAA